MSAGQRGRFLADLVRDTVAVVLGHPSGEQIGADQTFKELGFDSLTAVELRNRLQAATGVGLPATLAFDHPTATRLTEHLSTLLGESGVQAAGSGVVPAAGSRATREAMARVLVSVADDPIVIVGMACRLPGGVRDPEDLWRLLAEGTDAVAAFPTDRGWDLAELAGADGPGSGTSATGEGGFVDGVADFDAGFFGVSPREATATDPQQRLLLETSWEALEHAGIPPASLAGTPTGVFVGAYPCGYPELAARGGEEVQGHLLTGGAGSVASGRVAYTLGLEGPAVTVDTACSSSLVALHLAAQALRGGECDLALAGGVTVMATPQTFVLFSRQGGLAPDGRCKAFADAADGTGWAEGAGMLVVERLSDARRRGHRVWALLRGSAVNQDGASNGLTAPNGPAQQRVIRRALAEAGLTPREVDAVEAHGTGTRLGDPIEAQALLATYGRDRPEDRPLWLGSVKSNLGHTQAAAGAAGVIKMVLAMRHGTLPRTLHVDEPSSRVDWSAGQVRLLTENTPWPAGERCRRAGVSSFGVSGTNAHLIIEEAPAVVAGERPVSPPVLPWLVSARGPAALRAQAERLLEFVDDEFDLDVAELAGALATARSALPQRAAVLGAGRSDLLRGLLALADGEEAPGVLRGSATRDGKLGFLFAGQGTRLAGAGQGLYQAFGAFAEAFDEACAGLDRELGTSVREAVFGGPGLDTALDNTALDNTALDNTALDNTALTQAGLFAVEVALARLLESWGIVPDYVAGHSIGELAAAHVAGVWSLDDACRVVAARGSLMRERCGEGAMLAVAAGEAHVGALLPAGLDIAAVNGTAAVVVSGDPEAVAVFEADLAARGVRTSRLRVRLAFHSAAVEPMLAEFERVVAGVAARPPRIPLVSTVTGRLAEPGELGSAGYWVRQVRRPVRFADAVGALGALGVRTGVELGPDTTLSAMVPGCSTDAGGPFDMVPLLPKTQGADDEPHRVVAAVARLHVGGVSPDWAAFFGRSLGGSRLPVELPTYAFQRRRYWLDSTTAGGPDPAGHPWLDG
ncbi:MAG TPA: beta-ketoacyl synthase N-terminal-like domain-containing protein, partial [Pseudonocardiaceae bacterium]|nr:beta-ketoacyl synthase N-terminal-like domain-containing protein [Pseudonocardiaceae bacterium]